MQIDLIVIRTGKPKELSEFYEQIGMKLEKLFLKFIH